MCLSIRPMNLEGMPARKSGDGLQLDLCQHLLRHKRLTRNGSTINAPLHCALSMRAAPFRVKELPEASHRERPF